MEEELVMLSGKNKNALIKTLKDANNMELYGIQTVLQISMLLDAVFVAQIVHLVGLISEYLAKKDHMEEVPESH